VIDLAGQLADLLGQSRDVGEWREITFFELADPVIDPLLRFTQAHG